MRESNKISEWISKNDIGRNAVTGAVGMIPGAGSFISYLLDKSIPEYADYQFTNCTNRIIDGIEKLNRDVDIMSMCSEEFLSIYGKAIEIAVVNYAEEKINASCNVIIKAIIGDLRFDRDSYYLKLLDDISPGQLYVLNRMYLDSVKNEEGNTIKAKILDRKDGYLALSSISQLTRFNLCRGSNLTPLGIDFCEYINSPFPLYY